MPVPYTPDAVRTIRTLALVSPRAAIKQTLGWSDDMLDRVARKHGIEIGAAPAVVPEAKPWMPKKVAGHPPTYEATAGERVALTLCFDVKIAQRVADGAEGRGISVSAYLSELLTAQVQKGLTGNYPLPRGVRTVYLATSITRTLKDDLRKAADDFDYRTVGAMCAGIVEFALQP